MQKRFARYYLYLEAQTQLFLISEKLEAWKGEREYGYTEESDRIALAQEKAQARVYRRS